MTCAFEADPWRQWLLLLLLLLQLPLLLELLLPRGQLLGCQVAWALVFGGLVRLWDSLERRFGE